MTKKRDIPVLSEEWLQTVMESSLGHEDEPAWLQAVCDWLGEKQPAVTRWMVSSIKVSVEVHGKGLDEQERGLFHRELLWACLVPWKALYDQLQHA
ncbi:MAG TPA: hypothetical protein VMR25_10635 [Planctomycetaceae bacterium]|jgi:hypothetical protein|nr:hypothetical protein [Planctomycetaceae bacterium]